MTKTATAGHSSGRLRTQPMTPRERWRAALHMKPVDYIPFWPKLGGAYVAAQREPFRSMSVEQVHRWIGSHWLTHVANCTTTTHGTCSVKVTGTDTERTTEFVTPHGTVTRVDRRDEASRSWHPVKFPANSVEDVKILTTFTRDMVVEPDRETARDNAERFGEQYQDGLTWATISVSPLMSWVEWNAGVENAHILLMMHPTEVEELFDAMHAVNLRKTEIALDLSPADAFCFSENTSTTLISPEQYRIYCLRHIGEYAALAQQAGRDMTLHMCGHLKALLPMLAELPVRAFEAFTSPPVGNTRLVDGREGCPNVCLIGGTNANLWMQEPDRILTEIERDLDALPHHRGIVVTSGGMMPPMGTPETLRRVCSFVKEYGGVMD